jgi:hypothetical protein
MASEPREYRDTARPDAIPIVAYRQDNTVGTLRLNVSGLNTFMVGSTRDLDPRPLSY